MAQSQLQEIERRSQCDMVILFVATANAHKMQEIRAILGERFQYLTLNNFPGAPKAVEDADTFDGNALKKGVPNEANRSLLAPRSPRRLRLWNGLESRERSRDADRARLD